MIYPEFIYILGDGRYARGRAGERAKWVTQCYPGGLFRGVRARKPIIPVDAPKISRRDAGKPLCRALGLEMR